MESINDSCKEEKADMVVMGISGKSKFEKFFIGSNAVTVSQNRKYPMLIAFICVVNLDNKNRHFSPQSPEEMHHLHHIFDKYKPQYAFIDKEDITTDIIDYAEKSLWQQIAVAGHLWAAWCIINFFLLSVPVAHF